MVPLTATRLHLLRCVSRAALVVLALVGSAAALHACNIPVFRFALERWAPDPYRLTLFHRGPLTEAQQEWVKPWQERSGQGINAALRIVDLDTVKDEADRELFAAQASPTLPWLVVQYPQGLQIDPTVRAGPLSEEPATKLAASPLRTELIRRLADGETAVWLLLESGDAAADNAAATTVTDELKKLPEKLKLPELTGSPDDQLRSNTPLKVAFSMIRVPRNVPAEQPLVDMLLHIESDLKDLAKPMVFPVFGRGRALLPLIGAGITRDNIHESAAFLVGACSCEVKELNPGFDLLLTADWDLLLSTTTPPEARVPVVAGKPELIAIPPGAHTVKNPPITESQVSQPAATEGAANTPAAKTPPSQEASGLPSSYLLAILGVGVLAGVLVTALRR